ncbi:hypothetical protein ASPWEDRAFT_119323 [Aspergillus wentii DTO 134E9]|uniref:DUF7708 domain-containing protein n=1 Tax=Aspergillus wentii DTO 134E9 TaxID=1073089 RepID=A0A1L9R867_ASPWE|nr:uncharacterized protein ASPWEDRAFT_119323 [Aspergillus wentii DTO 134E9]OJJ31116.1 hypothetical protein ASPWEDRAFT_119323 [Aspergillus wentii DTO 134E9]
MASATTLSCPDFQFIWSKRFEKKCIASDSVTQELDIEYNELAQTWEIFQDSLPAEDQVDFQERPQDARDVLSLVRNVQTVWMSTPRQRVFSLSMTLCDRFLSTFDSHSILLMTLPECELYISLFYGSLQSLIKASANYPRIMEGLVKALVEVNESICLPIRETHVSVQDAIPSIARFYSLTFFFLGEFMNWYIRRSKCQLLKSPSQDVYFDFQNLVCSIRSTAKEIARWLADGMDLDDRQSEVKRCIMQQNESYLWEEARLGQVGLQGYERRIASQNTITRQLIWEIQHNAAQRLKMTQERESLLSQMLESASQQLHPVSEQNSGIACLTTAAAQDLDTSRFESKGSKRKYTRVELQLASKHLQDYFDSDDQIADFESDVEVNAEGSVVTSLQQWATNPHSQVLAVGGSPSTAFPSPVALISACYACFARQAQLPIISHFCSLPTRTVEGISLFEQGLIALTYSLIRQLIDCLPPVLNCDITSGLNPERFRALDGTLTSWKEVLSLVDILLQYAPPLLVCVVDGLDVIQDSSTDLHIRSLVRVLLTHTRHRAVPNLGGQKNQRVLLKVLFTVAGRPNSLVETLSENQLILSESNRTDKPATADSALTSDLGAVMMNA